MVSHCAPGVIVFDFPCSAAAPAPRPAARGAAASAGVGMLDNALAIAAAVLGAIALVRVFLLLSLFE